MTFQSSWPKKTRNTSGLKWKVMGDGDLLTLPTYMQFLLDLEPEEVVLEAIDTDELSRMARSFSVRIKSVDSEKIYFFVLNVG